MYYLTKDSSSNALDLWKSDDETDDMILNWIVNIRAGTGASSLPINYKPDGFPFAKTVSIAHIRKHIIAYGNDIEGVIGAATVELL